MDNAETSACIARDGEFQHRGFATMNRRTGAHLHSVSSRPRNRAGAQGYASSIECSRDRVLDAGRWKVAGGQIDCLEGAVQTTRAHIGSHELFRSGRPEEFVREPDELCRAQPAASDAAFQPNGDPTIEELYGPIGYRKSFRSGNANAWQ